MDLAELSQRAREGKPLYGESPQPEWIQGVAYRNSAFSQLKFCESQSCCDIVYADLLLSSCLSDVSRAPSEMVF
jgi:hypothetical protein